MIEVGVNDTLRIEEKEPGQIVERVDVQCYAEFREKKEERIDENKRRKVAPKSTRDEIFFGHSLDNMESETGTEVVAAEARAAATAAAGGGREERVAERGGEGDVLSRLARC